MWMCRRRGKECQNIYVWHHMYVVSHPVVYDLNVIIIQQTFTSISLHDTRSIQLSDMLYMNMSTCMYVVIIENVLHRDLKSKRKFVVATSFSSFLLLHFSLLVSSSWKVSISMYRTWHCHPKKHRRSNELLLFRRQRRRRRRQRQGRQQHDNYILCAFIHEVKRIVDLLTNPFIFIDSVLVSNVHVKFAVPTETIRITIHWKAIHLYG